MIQAVFTIPMSEFDQHVVEKIKNFFNNEGGEDVEIVIGVRPKKSSVLRHETQEEYFARLEKSIYDAKNNHNIVTFNSVEELEHRLVYEVQPDNILIHSCHGHYDD